MGTYTEYKKITDTTGWKSPKRVKQNSVYGRHDWLNLKNLMYYDDSTYAVCSEGVTKDIKSNNIYFYDFGFDVPAMNSLMIDNVDIRFKCLDDTMGGGFIVDDLIRVRDTDLNDGLNTENNLVKNEYWSSQRIKEVVYKANDWLKYKLTRSLINDESFGFTYRCRGTTENTQIPLIYGVQVKIDYTYVDNVETSINSQYDISADLSSTIIEQVGNSTNLKLHLNVANNQSGLLNNIYMKLSNNLSFADNTQEKTIPAKNTNNTYEETLNYIIKGTGAGIGTIRVTGSNLTDPITLTVLIATENKFNDKLISIHNSTFNNNASTGYGGGWYNGNNSITEDNYFKNNTATTAGADYYDAKTVITPVVNSEYEVNVQSTVSCKLTKYLNSNTLVTSGTVTLYEDSNEIATSSIDNTTGTSVFNYTPTSVGSHTLTFKYSGDGLSYTRSTATTNVTVTLSQTYMSIESNNLERNNYFGVTLYDSAGNTLIGKTVKITLCRGTTCKDYYSKTDSTGTAYLMITLVYGSYGVTCTYNGDTSTYKSCSVSDTLTVTRKKVNIISDDVYMRYGETASYTGTLVDSTNSTIAGQSVDITINNYINQFKTYTVTTANDGKFTLPLALHSDVWWFHTEFHGTDIYEKVSTDNLIHVYNTGTTPSNVNFDTNTINLAKNNTINLSGNLFDAKSSIGLKAKNINVAIYNSKDEIVENISNVVSDSDGNFSIEHSALPVDTYRFIALYCGDELYDGCIGTCTVNIVKTGTTNTIIESTDYYNVMGTQKDFTVRLTSKDGKPLSDKSIYFKLISINGYKQYLGTTDIKGYATLPIGIAPNVFDIETTFLGDETYDATTNKNILVMYNGNGTLATYFNESNPSGVIDKDYTYKYKLYHNTTILTNRITNFTLQNVKTGERSTVKVNTNNDGEAYDNLGKMDAGFYWVNINFVGDGTYTGTYYDDVIMINKPEGKVTTITGSDIEMNDGEEIYYTPQLKDVDGNLLADRIILSEFIHSNGTRFYKINNTDTEGRITQRINFDPDKYTVVNYFSEPGNLRSCTGSNTIIINNNSNTIPTKVTASDVTLEYGDSATFTVTLTNLINGELLSNKTITFEIVDEYNNNEIFTIQTDTNGVATYTINEYVGKYTVNYSFMGDSKYNQSNGTKTITVNVDSENETDIKTYDTNLTYNNGNIYAKLFSEGEPVTDKTLICTLKHDSYGTIIVKNATTNSSGLVSFPLTSTDYVGKYHGTISFEGDTNYRPDSKSFTMEIQEPDNLLDTQLTSQNVNTVYSSNDVLPVVITAADTINLVDHRIQFRFSNRKGDVYDYEQKISSVSSIEYGCNFSLGELPGGYYDVIITYPTQTNYDNSQTVVTVNIDPASTSITGSDLTVSYHTDPNFQVTVTDITNNELVVNRYVVFQIGNTSYNALTNSSGVASFNEMLPLGTYTIYYKVVGDENYYSSKGDVVLTVVPAITGLTINDKVTYYSDTLLYAATLLHDGRAVVGAVVVFTITSNGVSSKLTAITDSRGQAKILLTKAVGVYTVVARFDGMSGFEACVSETKTITVNRQPTILSVNNITEDRIFNMNLSARNKQSLSNKNITVNITNYVEGS